MAKDKETEPDEPVGTTASESDGGGDGDESLTTRIEEAVKGVLGSLLGSGTVEVDDGEEEPAAPAAPSSPATVEANTEDSVRKALLGIKADEDHQHEHERLAKEMERPPKVARKLTQILWGSDEG